MIYIIFYDKIHHHVIRINEILRSNYMVANTGGPNLYLYKIESQNLDASVLIVQQSEALYIICRRIQHGMESDMG